MEVIEGSRADGARENVLELGRRTERWFLAMLSPSPPFSFPFRSRYQITIGVVIGRNNYRCSSIHVRERC